MWLREYPSLWWSIEVLFFKEKKIGVGGIIGLIIGLGGVAFLFLGSQSAASFSTKGILVLLAASIFWASGSVYSKTCPGPMRADCKHRHTDACGRIWKYYNRRGFGRNPLIRTDARIIACFYISVCFSAPSSDTAAISMCLKTGSSQRPAHTHM